MERVLIVLNKKIKKITIILSSFLLVNNMTSVVFAAETIEDDKVKAEIIEDFGPDDHELEIENNGIKTAEDFISSLYRRILFRNPAESETEYWIYQIASGKTGAEIAYGFAGSPEFQKNGMDYQATVGKLYQGLLGRNGTMDEIRAWEKCLENGCTWKYVFQQFVGSEEFMNICKRAGINPGSYHSNEKVDQNLSVTYFISSLYQNFLGRKAGKSEIEYWINQLESGKNGAEVAYGFVASPEFGVEELSDRDYISCLYTGLFGRGGSGAEIDGWAGYLENGCTWKYVFQQFIGSQEYIGFCQKSGIEPGSYRSNESADQNPAVTAFVSRLYNLCLDRKPDIDGLNNWTNSLLNNSSMTAVKAALGFIKSTEFENKNLTAEELISTMYQVFLNRKGGDEEIQKWVSVAEKGVSETYLISGFAASAEFTEICSKYGIARGDIELTEARDINPLVSEFTVKSYRAYDRKPDGDEINNIVIKLKKSLTGENFIKEIFTSKEYIDRNRTDEEYVRDVFLAAYDREPTEDEIITLLTSDEELNRTELLDTVTNSEEFKEYCKKLNVNANCPYPLALEVLNTVGMDLYKAYKWSVSLVYYGHRPDMPQTSETSMEWYAEYGFTNKKGNCYVMAATFCEMARLLGYDAHQISGRIPLRTGGWGPHSWVEITMDGEVYVFDPDFEYETKRNGFKITYKQSGTWWYLRDTVMS